jgi:hypothetical protein
MIYGIDGVGEKRKSPGGMLGFCRVRGASTMQASSSYNDTKGEGIACQAFSRIDGSSVFRLSLSANKGKPMTAKSKKAAVSEVTAKKTDSRGKPVKAVKFEVVSAVPDLMPRKVVKQILSVEVIVSHVDKLSDAKLALFIKGYAQKADSFSKEAVHLGASALVFAWASGKLLNAAKAKLGRGDFGQWRDKKLGRSVMSERTSQRYMQLAKQCDDVKSLLEWNSSLRQAYIACGILPEPPIREVDEEDDPDAAKRRALVSSITGIEKKLRVFSGLKGKLRAAEKKQLKQAKKEIDEFFDQILG